MTLIEVMMALMLLMIVSLALIQSVMLAQNTNVMNSMRDEAVSVAEQRMNELRNTPFSASDMQVTSTTGVADADIKRTVRGLQDVPFSILRTVTKVNDTTRQVTLKVTWTYKAKQYEHIVSTVMRGQ